MVAFSKRVLRVSMGVFLLFAVAGYAGVKETRKESVNRTPTVSPTATPRPTPSPAAKAVRKKRTLAKPTPEAPTEFAFITAPTPTFTPIQAATQISSPVPTSTPIPEPTDIPSPMRSAASAVGASPVVQSASSDPVDKVFAAVQQQWGKPASGGAADNPNILETNLTPDGNPSLLRSMGQMLISLAFVILLGLSLAWIFRRYFVKKHSLGGRHIEWMGSYALSPKSKVHLIRVGGEHFLIGEGNNSVSLISKVEIDLESSPSVDSYPLDEEEPLSAKSLYAEGGFHTQLSQWQNSLENQGLRQEVNASLLFLKGLTQRLRRKGERNA